MEQDAIRRGLTQFLIFTFQSKSTFKETRAFYEIHLVGVKKTELLPVRPSAA
jgi:hypothetical protein